jgi:hypothetical protein
MVYANQLVTRDVYQVQECEFESKNKAPKFSLGRKVLFHKCETTSFLGSVETTNEMQPCNRIYYSTVN